MPKGNAINHCTPSNIPFSINTNTGPIAANVKYAVTNTLTRGVTNKSNIAGTILCNFFSMVLNIHAAIITGITCP